MTMPMMRKGRAMMRRQRGTTSTAMQGRQMTIKMNPKMITGTYSP